MTGSSRLPGAHPARTGAQHRTGYATIGHDLARERVKEDAAQFQPRNGSEQARSSVWLLRAVLVLSGVGVNPRRRRAASLWPESPFVAERPPASLGRADPLPG